MTNFLEPATDNPMRPLQAQMIYAPQVKIFEKNYPLALQTSINNYLASLAAPPQPIKYYLREVQYTSAQEKNKTISYSALLHLEFWEQE